MVCVRVVARESEKRVIKMRRLLTVNEDCSCEIKDGIRVILLAMVKAGHMVIEGELSGDGTNAYRINVDEEGSEALAALSDSGLYTYEEC